MIKWSMAFSRDSSVATASALAIITVMTKSVHVPTTGRTTSATVRYM